ncbi:Hypothetical Protein XCAW_00226 [Xanthomonas citri subsp. citri Aw12879]|nr:Hypothetical Protein XCAW_00226 [Xanthomonas citri subsp. citri Aw12879]
MAAGPVPARHRRTRRKYVRVGSYAASMPREVPRRWAGKDPSSWSVCMVFNKAASHLSGAVSSPIAGPCGGMDAATEPLGTGSRRVPRAVKAPRTRPGFGSGESSHCRGRSSAPGVRCRLRQSGATVTSFRLDGCLGTPNQTQLYRQNCRFGS